MGQLSGPSWGSHHLSKERNKLVYWSELGRFTILSHARSAWSRHQYKVYPSLRPRPSYHFVWNSNTKRMDTGVPHYLTLPHAFFHPFFETNEIKGRDIFHT